MPHPNSLYRWGQAVIFWVSIGARFPDDVDELRFLVAGVIKDITPRKREEEALRSRRAEAWARVLAEPGAPHVAAALAELDAELAKLPAASVDVVISNCVINLATDKAAVLTEIARVLRPGGRVGVSDVVAEDRLAEDVDVQAEAVAAATLDVGGERRILGRQDDPGGVPVDAPVDGAPGAGLQLSRRGAPVRPGADPPAGPAGASDAAKKSKSSGLSGMVLAELQTVASGLGITGTTRMRKGELIEAIKDKQRSAWQTGNYTRVGNTLQISPPFIIGVYE